MVFFFADISSINEGLSHQMSNLKTLIKFCYKYDLKLIKPVFKLTKNHNNNIQIETDMSKYYDLNSITVNGEKFKLYDNTDYTYNSSIKYKPNHTLIHLDEKFSNLKGKVNINYTQYILDISKRISLKLDDYMCIHVRRGDRITNNQIDMDTQPSNIKKIIEKYTPNKVYIMTNRVNELKELDKIENVYFYTDFDVLKDIRDNYLLYSIENNIMSRATIRCSTFNVNLKNKNNNYHCYLTNYPGWQ